MVEAFLHLGRRDFDHCFPRLGDHLGLASGTFLHPRW
jgi:hypothetical protein